MPGWDSGVGAGLRGLRRRGGDVRDPADDAAQPRPDLGPRGERPLAVDNERSRFARDLHDILGHSLTVITVKAELAKKLMDVDPVRARAEVDDLERLARDALADVRRAVEGYRELTLPGELARARTALAAAEIEAELPNSTDDVPSDRRELFAWTIREGVTNVIRHSHAKRCVVVLHARLRRDPRRRRRAGTVRPSGHGLTGLRERASAAQRHRGHADARPWLLAVGGAAVTEPTIRLLLADDQALVRGALSALLGLERDLEVVAEVSSGDQVVEAVREHRPRRGPARRGDAGARRDRGHGRAASRSSPTCAC